MTTRQTRQKSLILLTAVLLGLAVAAIPVLGQSSPPRYALLVGLDRYKNIPPGRDPLTGASRDLRLMRTTLQFFGFQSKDIRVLSGPQAGSAAIRAEFKTLLGKAVAGASVVFYFSGRGSVQPEKGKTQGLQPTLVAYEGLPAYSSADITMKEIEEFGRQLERKGAAFTVIVDACYQGKLFAKGEGRAWKNVPRCVDRGGLPRQNLYVGPGVFLSAAGYVGLAYEWMPSGVSRKIANGVFTDLLTDTAIKLLDERRGPVSEGETTAGVKPPPVPSYSEIMTEVRQEFLSRTKGGDYLPGQLPTGNLSEKKELASLPFFTPTVEKPPPPPPPPPDVEKEVKDALAARKEHEKTLWVVVDVSGVGDAQREKMAAQLEPRLKAYLEKHLNGVRLLPRGGARPDRVVYVQPHPDGLKGWIVGDEVDDLYQFTVKGKDIVDLMEKELGSYLQRQAYVLRLFRLTEDDSAQTLKAEWSARSEKPAYANNEDDFAFVVQSNREGLLYIIDQDNDGIVHLAWPSYLFTHHQVTVGGPQRWPEREDRRRMAISAPIGKTLNRAVLIVPEGDFTLPSLEPPSGQEWFVWDQKAKRPDVKPSYKKLELAHLRALLDAITKKQVKWAAKTFEYAVEK